MIHVYCLYPRNGIGVIKVGWAVSACLGCCLGYRIGTTSFGMFTRKVHGSVCGLPVCRSA